MTEISFKGIGIGKFLRVKIQNSNILNALIEHVTGEREMSSTQVTAGLGLLRKVMPDLSSTTIENGEDGPLELLYRIERVIVRPQGSES